MQLVQQLQQAMQTVLGLQWNIVSGTQAMMVFMSGTSATMGIMGGTWAMMEYCAQYITYNGGLLVVMFAQMGYAPATIHTMSYSDGTNANRGLQSKRLFGTKSMANA